ncbi:MAG: hypothetical protein J6B32_02865 [Spirochaetaceae bacterium]|nr:hypothetical protein [Spirochaetaceae bacterium]
MQQFKYMCKSIIFHDTFESDLITQHRNILSQLSIKTGKPFFPIYPLHCQIETELSLNQLKNSIKKCTIMPPKYKKGLLYRPLYIESCNKITSKNIFFPEITETAFIFGLIKPSTQKTSDIVNEYLNTKNIQSKDIRVFRIYQSSYQKNDEKEILSYSWKLGDFTWVKLKTNQ